MKVIKLLQLSVLVLLLGFGTPAISASGVPDSKPAKNVSTTENARIQQMIHRIEEIKNMDKSGLSKAEKKELRTEVRDMKKELKETGRGVYLSIGAIIIIILLLILIL